ncbi:MAG: hypothetical protein AAF460_03620, partial [Pseudomonadota bacterium]
WEFGFLFSMLTLTFFQTVASISDVHRTALDALSQVIFYSPTALLRRTAGTPAETGSRASSARSAC